MRIPKPIKRGSSWRIEFMHDGIRHSATHDTAKESTEWAIREKLRLKDDSKKIEAGELPSHTFNELAQVYMSKVSSIKNGGDIEKLRIKAVLRNFPKLAEKPISKITPKDLIAWRNARLSQVSESTVRRDMNLLSSMMNYALKELLWLNSNPFLKVSRPQSARSRNRRISSEEIQLVLKACEYEAGTTPDTTRHYVAWCFLFAIETAMRASEILSIRRINIKQDYVHLPQTKNGEHRDVPLLHSASDLIDLVSGDNKDKLIPITADSLKKIFARVVKEAEIDDLHFHDTRHEATTRMAQILDVKDLSKVTGHKDIGILINTYYNPTATEIAAKLRAGKK